MAELWQEVVVQLALLEATVYVGLCRWWFCGLVGMSIWWRRLWLSVAWW